MCMQELASEGITNLLSLSLSLVFLVSLSLLYLLVGIDCLFFSSLLGWCVRLRSSR